MSIEKALETLKYDVRLIEYNINNGILTKAELEKHLKELADMSQNVVVNTDSQNENPQAH